MPVALFGITNDGLNLFVNLVILFLVVVWLALVAWTYLDARRRIKDPVLVACATGASIFPFVGSIVYAILRPPEFLEDARERELETRAAELRVRQLEEQSCPRCEYPLERTYLRCPNCRARVKDPCESCGKPVDPRWSLCPYCEAPLRREAPPPRAVPREARPGARKAPAQRAARPAERAARSGRTTAQRQTASQKRSARASAQRQASAKRPASQRSPEPGGSRREKPGEDRPRPAPAS
jgi:hypothetical protein